MNSPNCQWPTDVIDEGLISELVKTLWSAVCVGQQCPHVARLWQRMSNPRLGDLVVELSQFRPVVGCLDGVEYSKTRKYVETYIIARPSGRIERWTNANFVAAPWAGENWHAGALEESQKGPKRSKYWTCCHIKCDDWYWCWT